MKVFMSDLKPALSPKGKIIFNLSLLACLVGCGTLLYFGYVFFHDRTVVFWVYNIYIVGLTGVVVYMVRRFVKMYY